MLFFPPLFLHGLYESLSLVLWSCRYFTSNMLNGEVPRWAVDKGNNMWVFLQLSIYTTQHIMIIHFFYIAVILLTITSPKIEQLKNVRCVMRMKNNKTQASCTFKFIKKILQFLDFFLYTGICFQAQPQAL